MPPGATPTQAGSLSEGDYVWFEGAVRRVLQADEDPGDYTSVVLELHGGWRLRRFLDEEFKAWPSEPTPTPPPEVILPRHPDRLLAERLEELAEDVYTAGNDHLQRSMSAYAERLVAGSPERFDPRAQGPHGEPGTAATPTHRDGAGDRWFVADDGRTWLAHASGTWVEEDPSLSLFPVEPDLEPS